MTVSILSKNESGVPRNSRNFQSNYCFQKTCIKELFKSW